MEQVTTATVDGLREALGALKLDTRGHKSVLKKRLRAAKKSLTVSPSGKDGLKPAAATAGHAATTQHIESWRPTRPASQDFDSYCVLDFEATCQQYVAGQGGRFDFPNEVRTPSKTAARRTAGTNISPLRTFRSSNSQYRFYNGDTKDPTSQ